METKALKILLSNDDGVHAEGIHALAESLKDHAIRDRSLISTLMRQ